MPMPSSSVDPAAVQTRLRQLLFALLEQSDSNPFESAKDISDDVELSTVGITSIDFLDFALSVEEEFKVAILDTIDPDELPLTLGAWQQLVCTRSANRPA
jgi:acyl carrier protein